MESVAAWEAFAPLDARDAENVVQARFICDVFKSSSSADTPLASEVLQVK